MTKSETIAALVPQTTNYVSEVIGWLIVIAVSCALIAYVAIRTTDKTWKSRINREAVK